MTKDIGPRKMPIFDFNWLAWQRPLRKSKKLNYVNKPLHQARSQLSISGGEPGFQEGGTRIEALKAQESRRRGGGALGLVSPSPTDLCRGGSRTRNRDWGGIYTVSQKKRQ